MRPFGRNLVDTSELDNNNRNIANLTTQVFDDPTEKMVDFAPIHIWQIGEENTIEYTLPTGYEEAENDWIGVYKVSVIF